MDPNEHEKTADGRRLSQMIRLIRVNLRPSEVTILSLYSRPFVSIRVHSRPFASIRVHSRLLFAVTECKRADKQFVGF